MKYSTFEDKHQMHFPAIIWHFTFCAYDKQTSGIYFRGCKRFCKLLHAVWLWSEIGSCLQTWNHDISFPWPEF